MGHRADRDWETWIRKVHEDFAGKSGNVIFIVDDHQLLSIIQSLEDQGFNIERLNFTMKNAYEMSVVLQQMVLHNRLKWYPGCGQIFDKNGNEYNTIADEKDDLVSEMASLVKKRTAHGRWKMDHEDGRHNDRCVTLGMACWFYVMSQGS